MSHLRKILIFSGILTPISCVNLLSACSKQEKPISGDITIDINKENSVQFTNNLLTDNPKAIFQFNLLGPCQFGDFLQVYITKQTSQGKPCSLIALSQASYQINIIPNQTSFNVEIELADGILNTIYEVQFTLSFLLVRSNVVVQRITVDNLLFENATPTYEDMLDIQDKDGLYILKGIKDTQWVKDALLKCNTLLIPTNIDSIDEGAFYRDNTSIIPSNIKKIIFGSPMKELSDESRLTRIGEKAFSHCTSFEFGITFPKNLKYIGAEAFANCSNIIGSIQFLEDSQIATIGYQAFYGDYNITGDLLIPSMLSTLGDKAFYGCGFDGTLHIDSKSLKYISPYAFADCKRLKHISCNVDQPLTILNHAFDNCLKLTNIQDLIDNVEFIGEYAFTKCKSVTSLSAPFSIKQIADGAFSSCEKLSLIDFSSITAEQFSQLTWQGRYIFSQGSVTGTVHINTSEMEQGWKDWFWKEEELEDYDRLKNWDYVPLAGGNND
mgnify:CR=1 FL=1